MGFQTLWKANTVRTIQISETMLFQRVITVTEKVSFPVPLADIVFYRRDLKHTYCTLLDSHLKHNQGVYFPSPWKSSLTELLQLRNL